MLSLPVGFYSPLTGNRNCVQVTIGPNLFFLCCETTETLTVKRRRDTTLYCSVQLAHRNGLRCCECCFLTGCKGLLQLQNLIVPIKLKGYNNANTSPVGQLAESVNDCVSAHSGKIKWTHTADTTARRQHTTTSHNKLNSTQGF